MREHGAKTAAPAPEGPESSYNWQLLMQKEGQNEVRPERRWPDLCEHPAQPA